MTLIVKAKCFNRCSFSFEMGFFYKWVRAQGKAVNNGALTCIWFPNFSFLRRMSVVVPYIWHLQKS